jgi:hypothetical protein
VRSGYIAAVGDDAALLKDAAPATRLMDLEGRSVLPRFFDAPPRADRERGGIPIAGLHSVADIVEVVRLGAHAYVRDEDGQRQLGESYLTRGEALRMAAQS